MNYKNNPLKDLVNNFSEYGELPTLSQMQEAIVGAGVISLTSNELRTNLITGAFKNKNHPFHSQAVEMVKGGTI